MEVVMIIVVVFLAVLLILGLVLVLLWAEKGVNDYNKKIDDKWDEEQKTQQERNTRSQ